LCDNCAGFCAALIGKARISRVFEGCSVPVLSAFGGFLNSPILADNNLNSYPAKDSADTGENEKDQAGTSSAAFSASTAPHLAPPFDARQDASLQVLMSAWPHLGPDAKRKIMAIIRTEDEKARSQPAAPGGK
jgi:hypothetical protein